MAIKHTHRYIAIPITGKEMAHGHEQLFGYRAECEQCGREPKVGDKVVEVKASWLKQVHPVNVAIEYIVKD